MAKAPERADGSPFHPTNDMKHPDPKKHQYVSFVKSGVRIAACICAIISGGVLGLAIGLLIAELIGVYEELV